VRPVPVVPRRRPVAQVVAAAAATVTVVIAGAAFAANGGSVPWSGGERRAAAGTEAPAPVVSSTPASVAASVQAPVVLPAGYKWYDSKSGFRVAWPQSWVKVDESRGSVALCAPGGPPVVAVREWNPSDPDLSAAMRREETAAALPRYQRLRMTVSPQQDSAVWEYTFTDPKMGPLHGLDRAVLVGGRAYLLQWRTPADKWAQHLAKLAVVTDTFRPARPVAARTGTPAGHVAYRSQAGGFQLAAPAKWGKVDESPTSVVFCAPGGPPLLGVRAWAPANLDPAVALTREEQLAKLPGYRRISLDALPDRQGAVLEYTFTDPKMGRLHGLDRAFVTPTGAYLLQWRTPADEWTTHLPKLGTVTANFRPIKS
jgi:hypothetical protein